MSGAQPRIGERSIELTVQIWFDAREKVIHLAGPEGSGVKSFVSNHPASPCFHPELYQQMLGVLSRQGCRMV